MTFLETALASKGMPDQGNFRANWEQNVSMLGFKISKRKPIRDVSAGKPRSDRSRGQEARARRAAGLGRRGCALPLFLTKEALGALAAFGVPVYCAPKCSKTWVDSGVQIAA